jgi:hypothetical protein
MTAFTAKLWERLENHAPSHYALNFDRNSMPGKSTTDATPTEVRVYSFVPWIIRLKKRINDIGRPELSLV